MTVITQITIAVALVLSIILPFGYYLLGEKSRGRYKTALGVNAFFFFGIMLVAIAVTFAGGASVQAATLQALKAHLQQVWVISQQHLLPDFPVSVVVLPLPVRQAQPLEQSVRIRASLVNLLSS